MRSEKLRAQVTEYLNDHSLRELSRETGIGLTRLSQWRNGKYDGDVRKIERDLGRFFGAEKISRKDEHRLLMIEEILQHAEDRKAIVAALALRG